MVQVGGGAGGEAHGDAAKTCSGEVEVPGVGGSTAGSDVQGAEGLDVPETQLQPSDGASGDASTRRRSSWGGGWVIRHSVKQWCGCFCDGCVKVCFIFN